MNCPKCGSPRFGYSARYQSYCCPMCGYEDKKMLLPEEKTAYKQFQKFMKLFIEEKKEVEYTSTHKMESNLQYEDFKQMMTRYIEEEVKPAQIKQNYEQKLRRGRPRKDDKKSE